MTVKSEKLRTAMVVDGRYNGSMGSPDPSTVKYCLSSSAVTLLYTYDELPPDFETRTNLLAVKRYGMSECWLSTSLFRNNTHGYYENATGNTL